MAPPVLQAPQADNRSSMASRPNRSDDLTATLPVRPEIAAEPSPGNAGEMLA
jgi:hypothetical protein